MKTRKLYIFSLLTLCLVLAALAEGEEHKKRSRRAATNLSDKPKIVTTDGHLAIQSAANHNISLITDDKGDVNFGGTSVKSMIKTINTLTSQLSNLKKQITQCCANPCTTDVTGSLCGTNGACIPASAASTNGTGYRCVCDAGYTGVKCDKKTSSNPCGYVVCLNGGICTNENGAPECKCAQGFFGQRCSRQIPANCNKNLNAEQGTISSVGYPDAYPANIDCTYIIRTTPGKIIVLSFIGISIQNSPGCGKDYIQVRDGASSNSPLLKTFCGSPTSEQVTSTTNQVYIKFKTDASVQIGSGFSLYYFSQQSAICGGPLTADPGSVASPGWPTAYNKAATCIWVVNMPASERVSYQIDQLVITGSASSCNSYLELHDGTTDSSPIIGKYCSNSALPKDVTTSNHLYIKFVTDGSGSLFKMQYTTPCGGNLTSSSGFIQSPYFPNFYPHKKRCVWTITVPAGNVITLRFPTFDVEPSTNCIYDYVAAVNGPTTNDPLIGRYCGSTPPTAVTSTMNQMTVVFRTDGASSFRGFRMSYTSAPGGCGGAVTGSSGNISSPTSASSYQHSVRCIWTITAADRTRSVQLYFLSFHLEEDTRCRFDYVMFRDGPLSTSPVLYNNTRSGRFCGTRKPPVVTSSGRSLTVAFITDISIAKVGFSAKWMTVPRTSGCDVFRSTPSGSIQSPSYPRNYPHNQNCKYTISIPSGMQIDLVFRVFQIEEHTNCRYDNLKIYDGSNVTSPLIGTFCGTHSPGRIVSSSNSLHLVFTSDFSNSAKGFFANYTTGTSVCGGMLHTPSGFIRSPNYPSPYRHNAVCTWLIHVENGNTIVAKINDLDIESSFGCRYDNVELRDGTNSSAALIRRLCGTQLPSITFKSTRNFMFVTFKSDQSVGGRGFELKYTSGCGGVFTDLRGVITSPNYPMSYPPNKVCNYTFVGSVGDKVRVNFTDFRLESNAICRHDYVSVHNGTSLAAPLLGKFCGSRSPFFVESTVSSLFMMFSSDSSLSFRGFRATYELIGCSGIYTAPNGTFSTPNYPNNYPTNRVCKWVIKVASGYRIQLNFTEIDVETHSSCRYDYLEIYNGKDETAPLINRYCSRHSSVNLTSSSNEVLVKFRSDNSNTGRGFSVTYSRIAGGCGGVFRVANGYIYSPNYPQNYPRNVQCEWVIIVQPQHNVRINFTDFQLESHASCSYDYVQVRDGYGVNATELARGCGNRSIGLVVSTGNVMIVKLRSDSTITDRGFKAYFTTGCGGTLNADIPGVITSPNYPLNYPHNAACVWVLRGTPGRKVTLTFTNFAIEQHTACAYDYLEVRQGDNANSSLINRFCGSSVPSAITSFGNTLYVKFVSDSSQSARGFRAQYTTATAACGGTFNALNGSFTSPLYPAATPANADCIWKIQVAPGSIISLSFVTFNIKQSSSCSDAYVEVRDGSLQSSNLIGRYCGTSPPASVFSTKENMFVRFYHSSTTGSQGFRARFGAVCVNTITYTQGYIASPNWPGSYPDNALCSWKIVLPPGRRIAVRFTEFDIEDHSSCSYDYLEARNGNSPTSPRINRFCGSQTPSPFSSSSNLLYLRFKSDYSTSGRGFRLYFDGGPSSGCGAVLTATNQLQYVTSPNYPSNYGNGASCIWVINAPNGHSVKVTFTDFALESGWGSCNADYVEFRDGATSADNLIGRYCGNRTPFMVHSHGGSLYMKFLSDSSIVRKGFRASYQMSCGGILSATTGIIRSPTVNNQYLPNQNCTWQISVTSGTTVRVTFSSFNLEASPSCANDYVLIRNGLAADSPVLGRFCGSTIPAVVTSTNSKISVQFVTNGAVQAGGFLLNYTQHVKGCGGSLSINDPLVIGNLSSPNYPNNYPINIECVWTLNVPSGDTIEFVFADIDIEAHSTCNWDYVELRDGGSISSPSLGKFCGSSLPKITRYVSAGNQLVVKIRSDTSQTGRGFTASWKIGCGKTFLSSSGTITSPRFPASYPTNRDCVYTIEIPSNKQIQVDFNVFSIASSPPSCSSDYLEIHDGKSQNSTLIGKYCGTTLPASFISDGKNLYFRFKSDAYVIANGFRAVYRTVGVACGGNLAGPTGTFKSPGYPLAYPRARTCQWVLTAPRLHSVQLKLTGFDIQNSASCTKDYLEVRDGDSTSSPLISRYCGNTIPPLISSTGTKMFVKFFSNSDTMQGSGFSASFTSYLAGCGGRLMGATGNFSSPNHPNNYPVRVECTWIITVPTGSISILFTDFLVEDHSNCNYDYVEIRDGDSNLAPSVGKVCGSRGLGFNYTSFGRTLYVKFRSDSSISSRGFAASWTNAGSAAGQCGGALPATTGTITTPSYPSNYPANLMCVWRMQVTTGHQVSATYLDMDIEPSNRCTKDYVSLLSGALASSPLLSKQCSRALPAVTTYKSTGNAMVMQFKSDGSGTGKGVKLNYNQTLEGCGGVYTAPQGTIVSPGYPDKHLHNLECVWTINVPTADRIVLYFNDFDMELASKCQFDYLEVRDGATRESTLLGQLCGPSIPSPVSSTGNSIYLRFRTDQSTALKGFNLTYTTACGGTIRSRTGVFSSPSYPSAYPAAKDCEWLLQVRSHYRLELTFSSFSLPAATASGCPDYVQIRNGTSSSSPSLGSYCGSGPASAVKSMSNTMYVKFHSDASANAYLGFKASFQAVCGGIITDTSGVISSSSLPSGSYHHDEKCTWLIRFPVGQRVSLKFLSFRMEYSAGCMYDYLEIRDGDASNAPVMGRFCGAVTPPSFISTGNVLNITFVTDGSLNYDGFSLSYSSAAPSCGGDLNTAGTIQMPKTGTYYPHNEACGWVIRAPAGQKIRIAFTSFSLERPTGQICHDYVEIREGPYPTSPLYGRYCGTAGPGTVTSTGESLFVRFHSDATINSTGFIATYQFVQGCGARLTATSSAKVLTSQNYPSNYPSGSYCEWMVSARDGYKVQISFTDFQLPPAVNGKCPSNSLIIRNGPIRSSATNDRIYCGNMKIPPYISDANIIRVVLNSSVAAKGFSASYQEGACGGAYTGNNGLITSPNYPSLHPLSIECTYTISVVAGNKIQLYFRAFDIEGTANGNCIYDYLEIRDGSTVTAPQIGGRRWCGSVPPPSMVSSSNTLYLHFKTDASIQKVGFAISYTSTNRGCGGDLNSKMGALTAPKYPSGYNDTYDCTWKITVSAGKRVKLTFNDFHLPYQASCSTTDYVEVRNGPSASSGLVGQYCGALIPAQFNSTTNQVYVRFKSNSRTLLYRGFQAFFDEVL